jgi:Ca2+-binding EF-hand superfamily protein
MKKLLALTLGLSLMTSLASLSRAADDAKKDATPDRAARRAEMLKKYDKNGDGKLDADERKAMQEDLKKQRENKAKEAK